MKTASVLTHRAAACLAAVICLSTSLQADQEVGYIEEFALAENREEALKQLIPGKPPFPRPPVRPHGWFRGLPPKANS